MTLTNFGSLKAFRIFPGIYALNSSWQNSYDIIIALRFLRAVQISRSLPSQSLFNWFLYSIAIYHAVHIVDPRLQIVHSAKSDCFVLLSCCSSSWLPVATDGIICLIAHLSSILVYVHYGRMHLYLPVSVCVGSYVSFEAYMLVINLIAFLLILPALCSSIAMARWRARFCIFFSCNMRIC